MLGRDGVCFETGMGRENGDMVEFDRSGIIPSMTT
jgi:hypothetical protein